MVLSSRQAGITKESAMKTLSLKVPETLNDQLEELARETRRSKSMVIRMAIEAYQRRGRRAEKKSFLAQARDLAGSVDGPPDLSTNRKHFETYGR
jgi:predicted transcriptional regulator